MSTNDYILHKKNSSDDWEEKILVPESGKVLGFDASLNPVMVTPVTSNPLPLYHYWFESYFANANSVSGLNLYGMSILSGQVTSPSYSSPDFNLYPFGAQLRSGGSSNGGYLYQASLITHGIKFGTTSKKFTCIVSWRIAFLNKTVLLGFTDSNATFTPGKGVYFLVSNNVITANVRGASNSAFTMTTTPTIGVNYLFDIEVNSAGTEVIFRIINPVSGATIETLTVTENIPTTDLGVLIRAVCSTTNTDICVLKYCGYGTIEGYNRARG